MSQHVAVCSALFPGISGLFQKLSATPRDMNATWNGAEFLPVHTALTDQFDHSRECAVFCRRAHSTVTLASRIRIKADVIARSAPSPISRQDGLISNRILRPFAPRTVQPPHALPMSATGSHPKHKHDKGGLAMHKTLVLGAVALALSAGAASAQGANYVYPNAGYAPYGYGYAPTAPLYGYAAPAYGFAAPFYGYEPIKRVQTGQQQPQQPQW
jgi:hypothetical protein